MNSSQKSVVYINYVIHKALYDLSEASWIDWDTITEKELMKEMMERTHGTINPKMIDEAIKKIVTENP